MAAYQFDAGNGAWTDITDDAVVEQLRLGFMHKKSVKYSLGQWTYECTYDAALGQMRQKNLSAEYPTTRMIRTTLPTSSSAQSSTKAQPTADLSQCFELLCGRTFWELPKLTITHLMKNHAFHCQGIRSVASPELAALAELFSSLGGCNYKYCPRRSALFCKPAALQLWLAILHAGTRRVRIGVHGSSSKAYKAIEKDPLGFSLKFAGTNAEVYGRGHYFGFTDEITTKYNQAPGKGTCIIALLIFDEQPSKAKNGNYTTFKLYPHSSNHSVVNGASFHDPQHVLPLGLAVSTDA